MKKVIIQSILSVLGVIPLRLQAAPTEGTIQSLLFGIRSYDRIAQDRVVQSTVRCWEDSCGFQTRSGRIGWIHFFFDDGIIAEIKMKASQSSSDDATLFGFAQWKNSNGAGIPKIRTARKRNDA